MTKPKIRNYNSAPIQECFPAHFYDYCQNNGDGGDVYGVEKSRHYFGIAKFRDNRIKESHEQKGGQKDTNGCGDGPGKTSQLPTNKGGGDNTSPGVNCPTAMASINSCFVSKPVVTSSASRKANNTYPLP